MVDILSRVATPGVWLCSLGGRKPLWQDATQVSRRARCILPIRPRRLGYSRPERFGLYGNAVRRISTLLSWENSRLSCEDGPMGRYEAQAPNYTRLSADFRGEIRSGISMADPAAYFRAGENWAPMRPFILLQCLFFWLLPVFLVLLLSVVRYHLSGLCLSIPP